MSRANSYKMQVIPRSTSVKEGKKCSKARTNKCVVGDVEQPMSEFGKRPHSPDGHNNTCRSCVKVRSKNFQNKVKENNAEFKRLFI